MLELEAKITKHISTVDKESSEYEDAYQMLFKTIREQARMNSLLKNLSEERKKEEKAWSMFTEIYGEVHGWE